MMAALVWGFSYIPAVFLEALTELGWSQGKGLLILSRRKRTPSSTPPGILALLQPLACWRVGPSPPPGWTFLFGERHPMGG